MKRTTWVDFGKGITILFVVLVHVLDGIFKTPGYSNYNGITKTSMAIIFTFIMPVFFALSGYLYHPKNGIKNYGREILKKAINLLFPYMIFSVIYVMLQHVGNSVHDLYSWNSLLYIYKMPIGYLWFLYILFLIFVLVGFFNLLHVNMYLQGGIYLLLFFISQFVNFPYFLAQTFTWTICFYMGYLINNIKIENRGKKILLIAFIVIFFIGIVQQYFAGGNWYSTNLLTKSNFLTKLTSIPLILYLFSRLPKNKLFKYFEKYGKYSLIIYLVHAPSTSIIRVILIKLGISNYFLLVFLITVITWYVCLFVCLLAKKFTIFNFLFSPYKYLNFHQRSIYR